jgi:synaptobrevin family protein YKT6
MKVYSIALLSVNQAASPPQATALGSAQDLSSFSFYQRGSVGEFMTFFTKVCVSTAQWEEADVE